MPRSVPSSAMAPPAAERAGDVLLLKDGHAELRAACDGCRSLHRACDGGEPCSQCVRRQIPCVRGLRRRPGPRPGKERTAKGDAPRRSGGSSKSTRARSSRKGPARRPAAGAGLGADDSDEEEEEDDDDDEGEDDDDDEGEDDYYEDGDESSEPSEEADTDSSDVGADRHKAKKARSIRGGAHRHGGKGGAVVRSGHHAPFTLAHHLIESDKMYTYHQIFRSSVGSLLKPFDVDSLAVEFSRTINLSDLEDISRRMFALAVVGFGAKMLGDGRTAREAVRRAMEMSGHRSTALALPTAAAANASSRLAPGRPVAAAANFVLGTVTFFEDQVALTNTLHRRAYEDSRRDVNSPALFAADYALDTVHLLTGARLFGMATNVNDAVNVLNECRRLDERNYAGHVIFRYYVVRKYLFEAFRRDIAGERIPRRLLAEICRLLQSLANSTFAVVHDPSIASISIVRFICQNYLSVEALTLLLLGEHDRAREAARSILRYTYTFPGDEFCKPNVSSLSSALKVFMDLGMPEQVQETLQLLERIKHIYVLAERILQYARTGERPENASPGGSPTANDDLEIIILESSFRRSAEAAEAERTGAARRMPGVYEIDGGTDAAAGSSGSSAAVPDSGYASATSPPSDSEAASELVPVISIVNQIDWPQVLWLRAMRVQGATVSQLPDATAVAPDDPAALGDGLAMPPTAFAPSLLPDGTCASQDAFGGVLPPPPQQQQQQQQQLPPAPVYGPSPVPQPGESAYWARDQSLVEAAAMESGALATGAPLPRYGSFGDDGAVPASAAWPDGPGVVPGVAWADFAANSAATAMRWPSAGDRSRGPSPGPGAAGLYRDTSATW